MMDREIADDQAGGERVHFRITRKTRDKIQQYGDELGIESLGGSARHLMFLGLEVAMQRMATLRSATANENIAAAFTPDAFSSLTSMARQVEASILDTKAITPDQGKGSRR